MLNSQKKILVTASCFPRWENDIEGGGSFVYDICTRLTSFFSIIVLTPTRINTDKYSSFSNIKIIRFQYYFFKRNNLINEDGIAQTLSRKPLYFIFVPGFLIKQLFALIKNVKRNNVEIIHAHWLIPQGFIACIYKKFFNKRIKIICTSHGSDLNLNFGFIGKSLIKFTLNHIDSLTVVSESLKEKTVSLGYTKPIEVIPMGVDTKKFNHKNRNDIKLNISSLVLLYIGNFVEIKGVEYLLYALPTIIKEFPDVKLFLIGDGILKEKYIKIAEELSITSHVIFTGFIENSIVPQYFSSVDIIVMPSLSEGSPVVMAEAMSCSSLLITSDIAAFQSHIKDNVNGFKVPVKNSNALAEKIIEVLKNKNDFQAIRENARQYAIENFDWEIVKDRYLKLLSEI